MAHRVPVSALCLLCAVCTARAENRSEAPASETAAWAGRFRKCTAELFSLTGRFDQDFSCGESRSAPILSGTFEVKRNGSYRIAYDTPLGPILVSDGESLTAFQRKDQWLVTTPVEPLLRDLAGLLTGKIPETVDLRYIGGAATPQQGSAVFRIDTPDHPYIAAVLLTLSSESPCIQRITLVDTGGCIIRTTLHKVKVNTGVRARRFQLRPPKYTTEITP